MSIAQAVFSSAVAAWVQNSKSLGFQGHSWVSLHSTSAFIFGSDLFSLPLLVINHSLAQGLGAPGFCILVPLLPPTSTTSNQQKLEVCLPQGRSFTFPVCNSFVEFHKVADSPFHQMSLKGSVHVSCITYSSQSDKSVLDSQLFLV